MVKPFAPKSEVQSLSGWKVIGLFVAVLLFGTIYLIYTQVDLWSIEHIAGEALLEKENYKDAQKWLYSAASEAKRVHADDQDLGDILGDLGEAYEGLGQYKEAESYYLQGLNLLRERSQTNSPLLSYHLGRLGGFYTVRQRLKEAEPYLRQMLTIDQQTLKPDDPILATDMNLLGNLYMQMRRYTEAEPLVKGALAIHERTLKPNDETLAEDFNSLGLLYCMMGRYTEAEPLLARAQAISPKFLDAQGYRKLIQTRKSAEKGDPSAQNNLGVMYERGEGVPKNNLEAVKWYQLSAEQGNRYAQCNLAMMHQFGRGIPKNEYKAVQWFQKSAQQGYSEAQLMLALMHNQQQGGLRSNPILEFNLYLSAAKQGHHQAEYIVGLYYEEGYGVPKNLKEAKKWLGLAAQGGITDAIPWRDTVSKRLNQMSQSYAR